MLHLMVIAMVTLLPPPIIDMRDHFVAVAAISSLCQPTPDVFDRRLADEPPRMGFFNESESVSDGR